MRVLRALIPLKLAGFFCLLTIFWLHLSALMERPPFYIEYPWTWLKWCLKLKSRDNSPDASAQRHNQQHSDDVFAPQFLLNGAVKSREVNNSVKECQHGDRDGDVKSQELVQDSTLLPMRNRPLISSTGVESSTDTLVPESDIEEQRERYSSALLQEQHILHQYPARMLDKKQQQMSTNHLPLRSVGTNSKREPNKANILTTLGQDQEGRRSMMVRFKQLFRVWKIFDANTAGVSRSDTEVLFIYFF